MHLRTISFCNSGTSCMGISNPEVPARHHHRVGGFQNGVEVFNGLGLFDFGHQTGMLARLLDFLSKLQDVGGTTHKGQANPIDLLLQRKGQILGILRRDARQRHLRFRQVQSLAGTQQSAVNDFAHHGVLPVRFLHTKGEFAVVQKHALAHLDICRKGLVVGVHDTVLPLACAHFDSQRAALHQGHFTAGNFADTQFGSLQICQHRGVGAQLTIDAAHRINGLPVHFVGAVREVDAGHIEALQNQLPQDLFRGRRRAKRGHDFGAFGNRLLLRHKVRRVRVWRGVSFRLQKSTEKPFLQEFRV